MDFGVVDPTPCWIMDDMVQQRRLFSLSLTLQLYIHIHENDVGSFGLYI